MPEAAAARLLTWFHQQTPISDDTPLPLDTLAERLGIAVSAFSPVLIPDTLGYLEPGEDIIFLRAGLPEAVRRFTLAHELGHAALHRRKGLAAEIAGVSGSLDEESEYSRCDDSDLDALATDDSETLGIGQVYSMRAQREGEANAFAAALLLPAQQTLSAYDALCERDTPRPATALAHQFGVSEDAALRRLTALLTDDLNATDSEPAISSSPATLDEDQQRAARADAPALVLAGPGSGKTSALLARVAYLVTERGVAPNRILTLTFSRKAAEELRRRLDGLLGAEAASLTVSTIHAFCGDVLRRFGPSVGMRSDYRLASDVEGYFLLRRVVNAERLQHYAPQGAPTMYIKDLLDAISKGKDDLVTPETYHAAAERMRISAKTEKEQEAAERALEVAMVYAAYQSALEDRGAADFADLIAKVVRLLRETPDAAYDLRSRYEHVLVDEFQDINFAMGELLRELVGRRGQIWAVGDVDQAIYRFRGASPANLLRFAEDFDGATVIALGRNYRSQPQILRAASAFAEVYLPAQERVELSAQRPDIHENRVVALAVASNDQAELDGLAALMRTRAAAGLPLCEQAVLVRTRKQVKQVSEGLRARGVHAQVALPLFSEPLVKTLLATLSLTVDPMAAGLLRAGDSPYHAFSDTDARAILSIAQEHGIAALDVIRAGEWGRQVSEEGAIGLRHLEHIIGELREAPTTLVGLSRYVFSLTLLGARLLRDDTGADAALVSRLLDICRTFDDQRAAGGLLGDGEVAPEVADWAGLLDYVRALQTLQQQPDALARSEEQDTALVMTAHAAKGLEFPAVYLPQLLEKRFPLPAKPDKAPAPAGLLRDPDTTDEDANLFYVALTRARDTLTLSYASGSQTKGSVSPYLAPIERALGDDLIRLQWKSDATHAEADAPSSAPATTDEGQQERRQYTLSEIESYQRCPQQYAYEHVYNLRPPHAAPVSLKIALQATTAEIRARFASDTPPTLDDARKLFDEQWNAARARALSVEDGEEVIERDETLAGFFHTRGEQAIERHWAKMRHAGVTPPTPQGAAQAATVEFANATVIGSLDRVESAPTPRVVQFVPNKLERTTDLRDLFYTLAAEQLSDGSQPIAVERVSLATHEVKPVRLLPKRKDDLLSQAAQLISGMAQADYSPKPEPFKCQNCPFWLICPS